MTDNQQFYQDFTSTYIDAANDFGFTAVDANELAQQTTQVTQNATTQVVSGVSDTIKTEIFALNTKINEILTKISALQAPNLSILPQKTDIARLTAHSGSSPLLFICRDAGRNKRITQRPT